MFTESQDGGIIDWPSPMESPIYNVPDDLLFKIFLVNANDQVKPITTTRFSSQVCKQWRYLILGSPSLWGKLLYLNELILGSDDWRNEVLSRTKKTMLTVRLCLHEGSRKATPLLLKILDEEWPRIQHLELEVCRMIANGDFDDDRWLSIRRPTENLRSIFHYDKDHQIPSDPQPTSFFLAEPHRFDPSLFVTWVSSSQPHGSRNSASYALRDDLRQK